MTFAIKFKVGFFKTRIYNLTVSQGRIILQPLDTNEKTLIIDDSQLQSVGFTKRENKDGELEIITNNKIYIGNFVKKDDCLKLSQILYKEFKDKVAWQKGVPD